MRLFEAKQAFGGLPKKAGIAVLRWSKNVNRPSLSGKTIKLPSYNDVQFFPLLKGKQFLLETDDGVYFGGTDERPFLVELEDVVMNALHKSEEAFFNAIKPRDAKALEKAFGVTAVRQGDWFAVPIPLPWNVISEMLGLAVLKSLLDLTLFNEFIDEDGEDLEESHVPFKIIEPSNAKERAVQLRKTHHRLIAERYIAVVDDGEGEYVEDNGRGDKEDNHDRFSCPLIGEGVLTAPGRRDLALKGPHAFFRTAYLFDPALHSPLCAC